ncbi:hypothetical protein RRG08_057781 [Elysia crispata]|uniref:EF-hand domain-containing protein n=1 Tax=Elysia crispata TaxID=231223 RepID=A0AAE0ZMU6_9GAST|nr:hypothetical protein RRG08_057781 [Elysia crispata]
MKVFIIASAVLLGWVWANVEEDLFRRYSGSDRIMDQNEFTSYWLHFDRDGDGNVTKAEFDRTWRADGLGDEERAPFFFLEMDRVADEVLNKEDFVHMFHVFDENGDGQILQSEFTFNWKGLFDN